MTLEHSQRVGAKQFASAILILSTVLTCYSEIKCKPSYAISCTIYALSWLYSKTNQHDIFLTMKSWKPTRLCQQQNGKKTHKKWSYALLI